MTVTIDWSRFEQFDGQRRIRMATDRPMVSLNDKHLLRLNEPAYDALGRPSAVSLWFDSRARSVAIRPAKPSPSTFPVKRQDSTAVWLVSAEEFIEHHQITVEATTRFEVIVVNDAETDAIVFDLPRDGAQG